MPFWTAVQFEQAMIVKELDKGVRRHIEYRGRRGRPNGGGHRKQVIVPETLAIAVLANELAERHRRLCAGNLGWCVAIEPDDISEHRPKGRIKGIRRLREQTPDAAPRILSAAILARYGK